MSDDGERELVASFGPTTQASVEAANLALVSAGRGEPDLTRYEALDPEIFNVIAALANLAAYLARAVTRQAGRTREDACDLLAAIRDDQEVRAARDALDDLGEGFPFDV